MASTSPILSAHGLHKSFGRGEAAVHVLRGLDIEVAAGEFLAVMGPSGCGKSTLLHILGLMTLQDSGTLFFDGKEAPRGGAARNELRRSRIGFVFQRFNLIGVLSARENVAISLRARRMKDDGRTDELFRMMGVSHAARRKPSAMSVGEQQRVALVRAMAHRPAILLADEPTGNLDSGNAAALLELLRRANRDHGQTIVMITHSAKAAAQARRTARMQDGVIIG